MRSRLKTDGLLPDLAPDLSTLFVLKFKYRTSISKIIFVKYLVRFITSYIWWRNWTRHVRFVFDFDLTTNDSNTKWRTHWVQTVIIPQFNLTSPNHFGWPFCPYLTSGIHFIFHDEAVRSKWGFENEFISWGNQKCHNVSVCDNISRLSDRWYSDYPLSAIYVFILMRKNLISGHSPFQFWNLNFIWTLHEYQGQVKNQNDDHADVLEFPDLKLEKMGHFSTTNGCIYSPLGICSPFG